MKSSNTAIYLVQRFLFSEQGKQFNLDSYDVAILFIIASYLDMPEGKCFGKQTTLAMACYMSRKEFQRRSLKLHQLGLILRFMKRKLYYYELGDQVTGCIQEVEGVHWTHMYSGNGVKKPHKRPIDA